MSTCALGAIHSPSVVQPVDHPSVPSACAVVGPAVCKVHLLAGSHGAVDPEKASGPYADEDPSLVSDNPRPGWDRNSLLKDEQ